MISLFEPVGAPGEIPVDLMTRGTQGVSLLEFVSVEEEATQDQELVHEPVEADETSEVQAMIEEARGEAVAKTRHLLEMEFERQLLEERKSMCAVLTQFAVQRARYFTEAETQVVRLALMIAAKILHREVNADATHLESAVRAALGRVSDGSSTTLRVRPERVDAWTAVLTQSTENKIKVMADYALSTEDCVLETSIGRVELDVATQLSEIERRFRHMLTRSAGGKGIEEDAL